MQKISSITDKLAGRAAILAGAAFAAGGVTQIVHSQRHAGNRVVGAALTSATTKNDSTR